MLLLARLSLSVASVTGVALAPLPDQCAAPAPEVLPPGPVGCATNEGESFFQVTCSAGQGVYRARIGCFGGTAEQGPWVGIHGTSTAICWGGIRINGWVETSEYL